MLRQSAEQDLGLALQTEWGIGNPVAFDGSLSARKRDEGLGISISGGAALSHVTPIVLRSTRNGKVHLIEWAAAVVVSASMSKGWRKVATTSPSCHYL